MSEEREFDHEKYIHLLSKNRCSFVVTAALLSSIVTFYSYMLPDLYESKCTVYIRRNAIADVVKDIAWAPSSEDYSKVLTYEMKSRNLLLKVIGDLGIYMDPKNKPKIDTLIDVFQKRTDIKVKDAEGLFTVSFLNENPTLAANYLNTLLHRYAIENNTNQKKNTYVAGVFLTDQIKTIKEKFDQAEGALTRFKTSNSNVLPLNESQIQSDIDSALRTRDENLIRIEQLESQRNQLRLADPLQQNLNSLQNKLEELRLTYTESYPDLIKIKNEIQYVKDEIRNRKINRSNTTTSQEGQKIEAEIRALSEYNRNLSNLINKKRDNLQKLPAVKMTYEALDRDRNNQKQLYEQLLLRKGQSEVTTQAEVQEKELIFRIIDPALVPDTPSRPNRPRLIILGLIGGFFGSFTLLLLRDHFDTSIRDLETLRSLPVSILGIVHKIEIEEESKATERKTVLYFGIAAMIFLTNASALFFELSGFRGKGLPDISLLLSAIRHYWR